MHRHRHSTVHCAALLPASHTRSFLSDDCFQLLAVLKISGFVISAGKYSVTLKATSPSLCIPKTAAHNTVFNKRHSSYTIDTHLITYEQTEHTMERANKTALRKE